MYIESQNKAASFLRHPVYAWLGLRAPLAQHTAAEHAAFVRWSSGRSSLVEIGVAEGLSALALRKGMNSNGTLYLIDPFHLSRLPMFNFMKRTARRTLGSCLNGNVVWIQEFSHDAVRNWNQGIELLLIDGDHQEAAVARDWTEWSPYVQPGGVVIFHDARVFEGGWTTADYGPVRLVGRLFRHTAAPDWKIVDEVDSVVVVKRNP